MTTQASSLLRRIDGLLAARTSLQKSAARVAYLAAARRLRTDDVARLIAKLPPESYKEPRLVRFRRSRIIRTLAYVWDRDKAIPVLKSLLVDDSVLTQVFAATALALMGTYARECGKVLLRLADRAGDPAVRYAAWQAVKAAMPRRAAAQARSVAWYWRTAYAVPDWCTVYTAEEWLRPQTFGVRFKRLAEVDAWLRTVFHDLWFRRRFRKAYDVYWFELRDGRGCRCAMGDYKNGFCHLTLPRFTRNQLIVLHELSHALAIATDKHDGHGPKFCRIYLSLVGHFLGREASRDLRLNLWTFNSDGWCP